MNRNIAQEIEQASDGTWHICYDWYPAPLPANMTLGDMVYLDTSYSFRNFYSLQPNAFQMGYASGNYLHSHFHSGIKGRIQIGDCVILEATNILANELVSIGSYCMFSWGSVVTDSWLDENSYNIEQRRKILREVAGSTNRIPRIPHSRPVIVEENVWVGFDAVILPGVRLGKCSVIGCKTVISEDVPAYAVMAGNPARIIKYLEQVDDEK